MGRKKATPQAPICKLTIITQVVPLAARLYTFSLLTRTAISFKNQLRAVNSGKNIGTSSLATCELEPQTTGHTPLAPLRTKELKGAREIHSESNRVEPALGINNYCVIFIENQLIAIHLTCQPPPHAPSSYLPKRHFNVKRRQGRAPPQYAPGFSLSLSTHSFETVQ